jgi:putative tryptophan/tyrosine transport system substrate-binding protein
MRRRQFIGGVACAAVWALGARAQQPNRIRTLAVLAGGTESDLNSRGWLAAFDAALQSFGWMDLQNVRIERRYAPGDFNRMREYAQELVDLKPDLVLVTNTPSAMAILEATRQIPFCS